MNFANDQGTLDELQFLMTREITHMKAFTLALESMGKPFLSIGKLPPTPGIVNQYFNDSTSIGDRGEPDARGPWNQGNDWEYVEAPAFQQFRSSETGARENSQPVPSEGAQVLAENGHTQKAASKVTAKR